MLTYFGEWAVSVHQNGWLGPLLSQKMTASVNCNGQPEIGCLCLVDWLAGPEAQNKIGCQICVWLQAPLPDYRTLCSPAPL